MEAAIVILGLLLIVVIILIWLVFLKQRTTVGMLEGQVRRLQDKDIKREYELELRKMKKGLEDSISTKEEKIKELKGEK